MTYPDHLNRHRDRARAKEQGITALDVPTGTSDNTALDWVAALPDPFRMVACGVCGDMVAAGDVAGHVVGCASREAS